MRRMMLTKFINSPISCSDIAQTAFERYSEEFENVANNLNRKEVFNHNNNDNNRCLTLIERNDNWTSAAYISWVGRCLTTCILLTELGNCMKDIASRCKEPTSSEHGESSQINNAINKVSIQYIETLGALCVYVSIRMFYSPVGLCMIWILYACTFVPMNILALRRALFAIWRAAGSIESEIQKRVSVLPQTHCCISRYRRTYHQKNKTKHSQWEKGWSSRAVIHTRDSLCLDFDLDRFCVCVCVVFRRWIKQTVLWVCVCVSYIGRKVISTNKYWKLCRTGNKCAMWLHRLSIFAVS